MGIYKPLTDYLQVMKNPDYEKWKTDKENKCTFENHILRMVNDFTQGIYRFVGAHPEYQLNHYNDILQENDLTWGAESMRNADVSALDAKCILALIVGVIRAERYSNDILLEFFKDGIIEKWLLRLKEIDN